MKLVVGSVRFTSLHQPIIARSMRQQAFGDLIEYGNLKSQPVIMIQMIISMISNDDLAYMVFCA